MRAGPLSNTKIIETLNAYYVPVYAVNEDYREQGHEPPEEKQEYRRVMAEAGKAGLSVGSVHVYIIHPDGKVADSLHVAEAAKTEKLQAALERTIFLLGLKPGQPLTKPMPQSVAPACPPGAVTLHLTARSLDGRGAWSDFPVEDWICLDSAAQKQVVGSEWKVGTSWPIERAVRRQILTHFYPATENNDTSKNVFQADELVATVTSMADGSAEVRLTGSLRMEHDFYHKKDGKVVEASVVGWAVIDTKRGALQQLQLVTEEATYGGGKFGIAAVVSGK